jgi:non-specific serine/threonine protein kinase/serine/threonine-protein kinase
MSPSEPSGSFPDILKTGSMLKLVADLVDAVPSVIGSYRVLERIGEGGMGVVYLAEQAPPLVRRVAIKLIRSTVPGDRALARFESERQTLAVMDHPNIARVFDAGSASDSRPYFVMEYVDGESITEYCDGRRLGIEPRLELFLHVCDGVQHAHRNAVIHRDLKPSNILVTTVGGTAVPKIIDFGVAKALDNESGPAPRLTQFGQIIGTPEYLSPEQAALDGCGVDTRTDVYALGVVLYELLVGSRPFERENGPAASFLDLCRRIREQEPERPSVRAMRGSSPESARMRGLVPAALTRRLRRDLDAIVIKALEKDPANRYATPSDLAVDLERHLHHRPIHARPPGPIDRFRKVLRRHRVASAIIAALSTTLVGLAIVGGVQSVRARREASRAEAQAQVANDVREFVLGVMDPPPALVGGESATGLVAPLNRDKLFRRIRERFADQPLLAAQLLFAAASHLTASSGTGRELDVLAESRGRIVSLAGPDSDLAVDTTESLVRSYMHVARYAEAEPLLLDALVRRRRLAGADDPGTWRTTSLLASLYKTWRKHDRAAPLFEAAIAGLERRLGSDDPDVLSSKVGLSGSYLELGRYAETEALLQPAVERIRRVFGERNYQTQVALYNLACARANSGRIEPALEALRESIDLGWNYPGAPSRDPLLLPLHGDPRFDALDRAGRLNDSSKSVLGYFEASSRLREGRLAESERKFRDLIAAVERVDGSALAGRANSLRWGLAKCWIRRGRFDDAEELLLPTLAAARTAMDREDERRTLEILAQCDIGRGNVNSALDRIAAAAALHNPVLQRVESYYSEAESEALQGRDGNALGSLVRASELGFDDADRLAHDLAFRRLRDDPGFQVIERSVRRRAL